MRIAVVRERLPRETRVAVLPAQVGGFADLGHRVTIEPGAGSAAGAEDEAYLAVGAEVDRDAVAGADLVLAVRALELGVLDRLRPGATVISLEPTTVPPGCTSYALDRVPRISRAQPMDALTSQSLVAGYRAAVVAAELLPRFLPSAITAADTIAPAQVLVLGTGVAGLQAIATMHRLGARVSGYDVRASAAEEIASLGATPLDLGLPPLEGAAGYAREMDAERAVRQRALLAPHVAAADVLICTAAVPGREAPMLVDTAMVAAMRPGSVVVDIAAESGGNVEGVRPGEMLTVGGATLWGGANVPGQLPATASGLYAENVLNLVRLMTRDGVLAPDPADEIIAQTRIR